MLDAQKRKHLHVVAIQKETATGPSAKDNKLKAVAEVVPSKDEETCSGLVFKRKRKADTAIPMPLDLDGRAPSYRECPPSASSPCDIVMQEGRGESASEGDHWDSSTDLSSFLQKILHSARVKERLENSEEDSLTEHMSRQLGESLVAHNFFSPGCDEQGNWPTKKSSNPLSSNADITQKDIKMTKDAKLEGSSQQANKDSINRRNGQGPKNLKFFLLVLSKYEAQA